MIVDFNLPFELDDGTPVTLHSVGYRGTSATVSFPKSSYRDTYTGPRDEFYDRPNERWVFNSDGVFGGGNPKKQWRLRNVEVSNEPEDWS